MLEFDGILSLPVTVGGPWRIGSDPKRLVERSEKSGERKEKKRGEKSEETVNCAFETGRITISATYISLMLVLRQLDIGSEQRNLGKIISRQTGMYAYLDVFVSTE